MARILKLDGRPGREALSGIVVAFSAGMAGVAGSFAATGATPAFIAAPIAWFLARNLPATVITTAIVVLGDLGEKLNVVTAVALAALILTVANGMPMLTARLLARRFDRNRREPFTTVALAGLMCTLATFIVTGALVSSLAAATASAFVQATVALIPYLSAIPVDVPETVRDTGSVISGQRRRVLASVLGTLGVGVVSYLLGRR